MYDSHTQHDDALWDRLVDGELSAEERRQLLATLDGRPDGWRRCALAFLEAQSWRGELRRVVNEPAGREQLLPASAALASQADGPGSRARWYGMLPALAASLLLAFVAGRQFPGERPIDPGVELADLPESSAPPRDLAPARSGDAITLVVNDAQGRPHRVAVPLVEGRHLGEQFADAPEWSSPLNQRLQQHGMGLEARRRYAPLWFEQENEMIPMVVPVDDARIVPVSRPVF